MHQFKNILSVVLFSSFGFESLQDVIKSTLGSKHGALSLYILGVSFAGFVSWIESVTESYIYSPSTGILILWVTTAADMVFGVSVAVSEGLFDPWRIVRAVIRVMVQTILVALFFNMSLTWSALITSWMVDSLLIIFTLSTFYSLILNSYKLGFITKDQYDIITGFVNIKNIIKNIKNLTK